MKYIKRFVSKSGSDLLTIAMRINGHKALFDERDLNVILTLIEEYKKNNPTQHSNKLTILLHSQGGDLVFTIKLAKILQEKYSEISTFVYNIAKSSMSLMAMAGTKLYLEEEAVISDFSINENESLSPKDLRNINIEIINILEQGVLKTEPKNEATKNALKTKMLISTNAHGADITYKEIKLILSESVDTPKNYGTYNFHLSNIHSNILDEFNEKTGLDKIIGFNEIFVQD